MTDVFKVRFDEREWWAWIDDAPVGAVYLTDPARVSDSPPDPTSVSYCSSYVVPEHMVERIEELPPEPPIGTVLWDDDDLAWVRVHDSSPAYRWWNPGREGKPQSFRGWKDHGQLRPYPRAARDEIEILTVSNEDWVETAQSLERKWRDEKARAEELQKRIDDALADVRSILTGDES